MAPRPPVYRASFIANGICATLLALLAGCASSPDGGSIFVPVGGEKPRAGQDSGPGTSRPQTPTADSAEQGGQAPEAGQPSITEEVRQEREKVQQPRHREQAQAISPAAASLVKQADQAFRAGSIDRGMAALQRAQRISPDAAVIYYKMAEGYVRSDELTRAEQFARKGVSLAGTDHRLQKSGWQLLSDIRRAQGNLAGAEAAENRASAL
ncbi:hypothetical protein [Hydrocarboniclastica marina]|uniref:Uncharacterized protein n=1 Tax=Hydrocarboniclastica marina TaxID=2259620 RepID=A0A4P7XE96_9ALTE|nr:hypothetical protein [Hydrocarboniclastica marina]QCF24925.1 hypothetical protein soil367_02605 [Hydrocarboniclastica marina]